MPSLDNPQSLSGNRAIKLDHANNLCKCIGLLNRETSNDMLLISLTNEVDFLGNGSSSLNFIMKNDLTRLFRRKIQDYYLVLTDFLSVKGIKKI